MSSFEASNDVSVKLSQTLTNDSVLQLPTEEQNQIKPSIEPSDSSSNSKKEKKVEVIAVPCVCGHTFGTCGNVMCNKLVDIYTRAAAAHEIWKSEPGRESKSQILDPFVKELTFTCGKIVTSGLLCARALDEKYFGLTDNRWGRAHYGYPAIGTVPQDAFWFVVRDHGLLTQCFVLRDIGDVSDHIKRCESVVPTTSFHEPYQIYPYSHDPSDYPYDLYPSDSSDQEDNAYFSE